MSTDWTIHHESTLLYLQKSFLLKPVHRYSSSVLKPFYSILILFHTVNPPLHRYASESRARGYQLGHVSVVHLTLFLHAHSIAIFATYRICYWSHAWFETTFSIYICMIHFLVKVESFFKVFCFQRQLIWFLCFGLGTTSHNRGERQLFFIWVWDICLFCYNIPTTIIQYRHCSIWIQQLASMWFFSY